MARRGGHNPGPHQHWPSSLRPVTEYVLQVPPVAGNQQSGYVLDKRRLVGYVALPMPLVSLVPAPGALANVTLVRGGFGYTVLRAQWGSHCGVYQLFRHATARLRDRSVRERAFPLEAGCVYYLPSDFFARARLSFAPVTTRSVTLLLTVLNPGTLRRLLQRVEGPIHGSLSKLQSALSSLQALEQDPDLGAKAPC